MTETMPFFFDTEFIERGPDEPVRLISIGLVKADGTSYYAETDVDLSLCDDWLHQNVVPHLNRTKFGGAGLPREQIRDDILTFVGNYRPEFWGYVADYDWMLMAQLFGRMMDMPRGWSKLCLDLKQWMYHLGVKKAELPVQTGAAHNALEDARWNRDVYEYLDEYEAAHVAGR
jgi:hypothetical protein